MNDIFKNVKNDQMTPELNREMNDLFIKGLAKTIRPMASDAIDRIGEEMHNAESGMPYFSGSLSGSVNEMDEIIRTQNRRMKRGGSVPQAEEFDDDPAKEDGGNFLSFHNREQLLENLNLVYVNLIEFFKDTGLNDRNSESLINSIQVIEKSIDMAGGEVENPFAPEDFVSGLESPDTGNDAEEKAQRVIDNTVKFYKAGKVSEIDIVVHDNDEKYIKVVFSGYCRTDASTSKQPYTATGFIGPIKKFIGVEAIDYIYRSPNGGSMYVRSFEGGRWINKSNDFSIIFDEFNIESYDSKTENSAHNATNDEIIQEEITGKEAHLSHEGEEEEILDFEIEEK